MERPLWTYQGRIDTFGLPEKQRDNIMRLAIQEIHSAGGQLQIRRLGNQYDTDRYMLHADLHDPRPLQRMLANLACQMPADHPEMEISGYDRASGRREDLILRSGRLTRRSYSWQPEKEVAVR